MESFDSFFDIEITNMYKYDHDKPYITKIFNHYGFSWLVKVFVDESGDFIGFELYNMSSVEVAAQFTMTLLHQNNGEDVLYEEKTIQKFTPMNTSDSSWGGDLCEIELIKNQELGYCVDNLIKLRIDISLDNDVELMNQPLALACANSASEQDLIDIADHDISKVIIPLSGVRAGHIEKLQDKMLKEKKDVLKTIQSSIDAENKRKALEAAKSRAII